MTRRVHPTPPRNQSTPASPFPSSTASRHGRKLPCCPDPLLRCLPANKTSTSELVVASAARRQSPATGAPSPPTPREVAADGSPIPLVEQQTEEGHHPPAVRSGAGDQDPLLTGVKHRSIGAPSHPSPPVFARHMSCPQSHQQGQFPVSAILQSTTYFSLKPVFYSLSLCKLPC